MRDHQVTAPPVETDTADARTRDFIHAPAASPGYLAAANIVARDVIGNLQNRDGAVAGLSTTRSGAQSSGTRDASIARVGETGQGSSSAYLAAANSTAADVVRRFSAPRRREVAQLRAELGGSPLGGQGSGPLVAGERTTGLPSAVSDGVESLSGVPMDGVRVHYNSQRPAGIGALAYTQGSEIWMGAGHEDHIAHEAWHVAQQARGQVRATGQVEGQPVNTDGALEHEAEVMGARAQLVGRSGGPSADERAVGTGTAVATAPIIQGFFGEDPELDRFLVQFLATAGMMFLVSFFGKPAARERQPEPDVDEQLPVLEVHDTLAMVDIPDVTALMEQFDPRALPPMNAQRLALAVEKIDRTLKFIRDYDARPSLARIDAGICTTVLEAVAIPRAKDDDRLASGYLGPDQAEQVINALVYMSDKDFEGVLGTIRSLEGAARGVFLKALAARQPQYRDQGADTEELLSFGEQLGDVERSETVIRQSSLRDVLDKDEGLRQRFVNTCGPTSFQVAHGELDPMYAWNLNSGEVPEESLNPSSPAAMEQLAMLGVKDAPPIALKPLYDGMVVKFTQMKKLGKPFLQWLGGQKVKSITDEVVAEMFGVDPVLVGATRRFAPFKAKGSSYAKVGETAKVVNKQSGVEAGIDEFLDPQRKGKVPEDTMEEIDRTLIGGRPVPIGISFPMSDSLEAEDEPEHQMMLVDIRGTDSSDYEYLCYEPTKGKSVWFRRIALQTDKAILLEQPIRLVHILT